MTDADYLAAWHQVVLPLAAEFQPDLVIITSFNIVIISFNIVITSFNVIITFINILITSINIVTSTSTLSSPPIIRVL